MTDQEIQNVLQELRFSSGLSQEDLQKLASISELVELPASTVIFSEGDSATDLYVLLGGRVELCMNVPAKGCLPVLTLGAGDLLGWSPALKIAEMTATATTIKETPAVRFSADELQKLCEEDHDVGYEVMRRIAIALSQRLVATRLQVLDVFADPVTEGQS